MVNKLENVAKWIIWDIPEWNLLPNRLNTGASKPLEIDRDRKRKEIKWVVT